MSIGRLGLIAVWTGLFTACTAAKVAGVGDSAEPADSATSGGDSAAGAQDPCEYALAAIEARYSECEAPFWGPPDTGGCSMTQAFADCEVACYGDASCEAVAGTDDDAHDALNDCLAGCAEL